MRVAFADTDRRVVVHASDPDLGREVVRLFPSLAVGSRPGEGWHLRVQSCGGGHRIVERDRPTLRHRSRGALLADLEFRILGRLLAPLANQVHLHAAGAVVGGKAVLAVGPSGAGKSSLALAWSSLGFPVLGDDLLLVGGDGRVRGFPRLAKIHRSRLRDLGLRLRDTVAPDDSSPEAWVDPNRGRRWPRGEHPVALVAAVRWDGGALRMERLGGANLLQHLMGHRLSTGLQGGAALDPLAAVADGAEGRVARFGRAAELAEALVREVEEGAPGPPARLAADTGPQGWGAA